MKKIVSFSFIICFLAFFISSCKKDSFITSKDALLLTSEDTLHFDTVFTTLGSTTQYLKIFNANDQKLKISSLQLMGGAASFFKLNVDGLASTSFTDIEIEANDSLYLFTTVKINPNTPNLTFLVRDSIQIQFNGNTKWIQLQAYGKNARFMNNAVVTSDSSLTNDLPIVILGSLTVNQNKTLTIPKGTNLYIHPNAPIVVNGTLNAIGDTNAKIVFQGIRIDDPYKNYSGGWSYIYFSPTSKNNHLKYCVLKNAYQGVVLESPATNNISKLVLEECILDNIYDKAILCSNSSVDVANCLISNVGFGFYAVSGGTYNFNHCTFVSISNDYLSHKNSLITLSNTNSDQTVSNVLNLAMSNSIIYGEGGLKDDEIDVPIVNSSMAFNVKMDNVLYKQKTTLSSIVYTNSLQNQNPLFDSINTSNHYYNFRLKDGSPCIDAASSTINIDLDGNPRPVGLKPDIGCYEKQ